MIAETQPTVKLEGLGQGQGPVGAQSNSRHLLRLCPLHSPSESGHLTSQGLFPSCADVNQHICHTNLKACHNAGMGYREMPIQVRAGLLGMSWPEAGPGAQRDRCSRYAIKRQVILPEMQQILYRHCFLYASYVHITHAQSSGKAWSYHARDCGFEST